MSNSFAILIEFVICLAFCTSGVCTSDATEPKRLDRADAAPFVSGINACWRWAVDDMKLRDDDPMYRTRDETAAPYSWRFAALPASGLIDAPQKYYDSNWKAKPNEYWRKDKRGRRRYSFCPLGDTRECGPYTDIMAIRGEDTAFDSAFEGIKSHEMEKDAIVLVEVTNSDVHWMKPGDLDVATLPRQFNAPGKVGIGGHYPDGFFIGFADGNVWFIKETVPFETLEKFFTLKGATEYDREKELGNYVLERIKPYEQLSPQEKDP